MVTTDRLETSDIPDTVTATPVPLRNTLNWSAIIGGTIAAMGIHVLLSALGVGAGLGTFSPTSDTNPATNFSIGSAIVWTICALASLWVGGFLAGRFSHSLHSGFIHGVLVWSLSLIITLILVTVGGGMVMGGAIKALGEGAKVAAPVSPDIASDGVKRTGDQLLSFTDEAMQNIPANTSPRVVIHARREISFAVAKLFSPFNDVNSQENRAYAIRTLVDNAQMAEPDATKTVDGWITSHKNLRAELDNSMAVAGQKARHIADQVSGNLALAAIWAFFGLLTGLVLTAMAGSMGAKRALFHESARPLLD